MKHLFSSVKVKAIAVYSIFFGSLFYTTSCMDKLDTRPQGVIDPGIAVSSEENIDKLIIGVYAALNGYLPNTGNAWMTAPTNWVYGDVTSDDAYKGSEITDQGPALEIEKFVHLPTNVYFENKWKSVYEGVYRANGAISALLGSDAVEEKIKNEKLAEVKFLRGHYYFELKKLFNKVPYMNEESEDIFVKNFEGEELTWKHIEEDFQAGVDYLPESQPQSGRPTKGSAQAYLGKSFLYQQKYNEAKVQFDAVVEAGKYQLLAEYTDIYDPSKKGSNSEKLFSVQHSVEDGASGNANADKGGTLNGIYETALACCGFFAPTQDVVNAHKTMNGLPILPEADGIAQHNNEPVVTSDYGLKSSDVRFTPYGGEVDPRLDYSIGRRGIPFYDWGVHPGQSWARDPAVQGHYTQKKRFISKAQEDAFSGIGTWGGAVVTAVDYHVIRYADVLLMLAECEVEVGSLARATELVNMVRNRAKNSTYVKDEFGDADAANYRIEPYPTFADKDIARRAVRFERRLELTFEGHRFFDLVRWGIVKQRIDDFRDFEKDFMPNDSTNYITYIGDIDFTVDRNEYFPIPQNQIDLSTVGGNQTLQQNPGY